MTLLMFRMASTPGHAKRPARVQMCDAGAVRAPTRARLARRRSREMAQEADDPGSTAIVLFLRATNSNCRHLASCLPLNCGLLLLSNARVGS